MQQRFEKEIKQKERNKHQRRLLKVERHQNIVSKKLCVTQASTFIVSNTGNIV